jgi:hypothetical protein
VIGARMSRHAPWLAAILTGTALAAAVAVVPMAARAQATQPQTRAADAADVGTRLIQISQIDPKGGLVGTPNEVACPPSGCQTIIDLTIAALPEPFLFSVEFVGSGAYVTLAPRSIAISEVLEFGEGHKGPIFVPLRGRDRQLVSMAFIIVRSATLRALEPDNNADVLASGRVFNRKRYPDLTLRVTFSPPGA